MKKDKERNDKIFIILAKNLRTIRESKNISIEELSKKTGIREKYLKRIEKGSAIRVTTLHIFKIAAGLKIKPSELVYGI